MIPAKIFIDEFGNTHLNLSQKGTFSHFIYTSVIIQDLDTAKARKILSEICTKFKLGENLKSSKIKTKNFKKRKDILLELLEKLDFVVDVMVIDKSRISSDGLRIKRIFYKYFQSLLQKNTTINMKAIVFSQIKSAKILKLNQKILLEKKYQSRFIQSRQKL